MKITIPLLLLIAILLAPFNYGDFYNGDNFNRDSGEWRNDDPRVQGWYAIEDWELEVCSKWGGTEYVEDVTYSDEPPYLSQLTVTLQGQKTEYDVAGTNTTLYEIAYYIRPLQNDTYYAVRLFNSATLKSSKIVGKTLATVEGASDYIPKELDAKFDKVQMRFEGPDRSGIFTMPIVDSKNGYTQESTDFDNGFSSGSGFGSGSWSDW